MREARAWAEETLARWETAVPEMLPLVVSELATNAITHTRSGHPNGQFTLRLTLLTGDRVRLVVRDAGPLPGRVPTRRTPRLEATHGRGLALVEALCLRWGALAIGTGVYAEITS